MVASVNFPHYYLRVDNDITSEQGAGRLHSSKVSATKPPTMHHRVTAYSTAAADDIRYELELTGTPDRGGVTYGGYRGTKPQPAVTPWTVTVFVLPGMRKRKVDPELNSVIAPPTNVKMTPTGITCEVRLVERSISGKPIPFTDPARWPLTGSTRLTFDIVP